MNVFDRVVVGVDGTDFGFEAFIARRRPNAPLPHTMFRGEAERASATWWRPSGTNGGYKSEVGVERGEAEDAVLAAID